MARKFDVLQLAPAWLSVALAAGKDKNHPVLDRTVAIESYETGARLVSTDSYMLLHAWAPAVGHEDDPEPELDEAPDDTVVAIDSHGRAAAMLRFLLNKAKAEDEGPIDVVLDLDPEVTAASTGFFAGMERGMIALESPGLEAVALETFEAAYPDWRRVLDGFKPKRAGSIGLNPELVARLAKLGPLHENKPLVWHFGGELAMACVDVRNSKPAVAGAVMPVRWDFTNNRPDPVEVADADQAD